MLVVILHYFGHLLSGNGRMRVSATEPVAIADEMIGRAAAISEIVRTIALDD